jgi:hypothetical protein
MSAFWKSLHQLAHGLLVNGGYLGGRFPTETSDNVAGRTAQQNTRKNDPARRPAKSQLAPCQ